MNCYYCGFAHRYLLQLQFYHGFPLSFSLFAGCRVCGYDDTRECLYRVVGNT